ncbi:MAG: hypothetical protein ACLPKT_23940 [Methylocella sp.]
MAEKYRLPLPRGWYEDDCAREAQSGNPMPLIGYLRSGGSGLSPAMIDVIVEALETKRGKRYRDMVRQVGQCLIALRIEDLVHGGMKKEAAVEAVMEERNCSRRHIFNALAAFEKTQGQIT